jgi:ADP-ribose pyrophosphatase YjhB (NUDIX family)
MRHYPDNPIVAVGVVVIRRFEARVRVLLIKRRKPPRAGTWSIPGGRQRLGETLEAAARREVYEETGLELAGLRLLDVVDSITRDDDGAISYHYSLIDFAADWAAGEARASSDAAEVCWADPEELESYDLWRETRRLIGIAVSGG